MGLASIISESDLTTAAPLLSSLPSSQLTSLYGAACGAADSYIGRNLASTAATEYYDGSQNSFLNMKRWPITTLSEVRYDLSGGFGQVPSSFGTNTVLVLGTDFICDYTRGILKLLRNVTSGYSWFDRGYRPPTVSGRYGTGLVAPYIPASWGQVLGSVMVTYTAGYTTVTIPKELITAIAQIAVYMSKMNDSGGLQTSSTHFIDVTDSFAQTQAIAKLRGGVPELGTSREILDTFRSPIIGTGWVLS